MKKIALFVIFSMVLFFMGCEAEAQKIPNLDKSPHDISYLRASRGVTPVARVLYGRPQKKDRKVFGKLVKYGKIWRAGANEATEITFYQDVEMNGEAVKAGTYALFVIPNEDKWTIILNRGLHQWGAYQYKKDDDVLRTDVVVGLTKETVEAFTITFDKKGGDSNLIFAWDETQVKVPISWK